MDQNCIVFYSDYPSYPNISGDYSKETSEHGDILGSLFMVCGGKVDYSSIDEPRVFISGLLDIHDKTYRNFVEILMKQQTEDDARVIIIYWVTRNQSAEHVKMMGNEGFEIVETGIVTPDYADAYSVCIGNGKMLKNVHWLREVEAYDPFFLMISRGEFSSFEKVTIDAARMGIDPVVAGGKVLSDIDKNDKHAVSALGDFDFLVWLTGPDLGCVQINANKVVVSSFTTKLAQVSKELGITLFNAGSLRQLNNSGFRFQDLVPWMQWEYIPNDWIKTV